MTKSKTTALVEAEVFYIPRNIIHPDPDQPRVKIDSDLQASIDSDGIIQAITVRPHPELEDEWMIVDGERRYLGGAHLKTIPCRIRLDLESPVDRLITQLAANSGKLLSPVELARAYKKALDADKKLTQVKLAERLGIPRSTIGDRIRLIDLNPAWLDAIIAGKLQVSHAPILSTFSAVPAEYQAKAAKNFFEDYRTKSFLAGGGSVPIGEMPRLLYVAFRDYIKETSKTPGYRGPTIEIKSQYSDTKVKYSADITVWRPCFRAYEKKERKERAGGQRLGSTAVSWLSAPQKAVKALKAAGFDPPLRPVGNTRVLPEKDEAVIVNEQGFAKDLHPRVLLETIDPSTITYVKGNFGGDELFTSDAAAVAAARTAYNEHVTKVTEKELAPLRSKLTEEAIAKHAVSGAGSIHLVRMLNPDRGFAKVVALALGITIGPVVTDSDEFDEESDLLAPDATNSEAERFLSALAAVKALDIPVPDDWQIGQLIRKGISDVPFKVAKHEAPKSKKQQKREARAAGKQVGDRSRAKNMRPGGRLPEGPVVKVGESLGVDVVRDATPEEIEQMEEELVEA